MKMAILMFILLFNTLFLYSQVTDSLVDTSSLPDEKQILSMDMDLGLEESKPAMPSFQSTPVNPDSVYGYATKLPYHESFLAGAQAANELEDGKEWGIGGFLSGISLNAVGASLVYLSAATFGHARPLDIPSQYSRKAFREGYAQRSKYIYRRAALTGGAVGTALQVVLLISFFLAVSSADDDDTYKMPEAAIPAHPGLSVHFDY